MTNSEQDIPEDPVKFLDSLLTLEENWDGYGGCTFDPCIITTCKIILPLLRQDFAITPMANGVVDFTWETEHGHAALEVGKTRYSMYIKRVDNPQVHTAMGNTSSILEYIPYQMRCLKEQLFPTPKEEQDETLSSQA